MSCTEPLLRNIGKRFSFAGRREVEQGQSAITVDCFFLSKFYLMRCQIKGGEYPARS